MEIDKQSKLEETVKELNDPKNGSFKSRVEKAWKVFAAVGYWGMLLPEYQRAFAEETSPILNWKERDLTIRNAVYFGLGLSALKYLGGEGAGLIPDLDIVENTKYYFISWIADFSGTTVKNLLQGYAAFDTAQSLGRIIYSQRTGKAAVSFCLRGAFFNAGHFASSYFRKRT